MHSFSSKIFNAIRQALPPVKATIPLHEPCFQGNEWKYVKECIDTGWVSSVGKYVDRFEEMLSEFTGARYAIATVNGTAALHMCLLLAGVQRNDEVLLPALTFVATANVIRYCGAEPHFVDSYQETLGLDVNKLRSYLKDIAILKDGECFNRRTERRIKAVIPMHTFGHSVDLDPLVGLCTQYQIDLIEDAAESLGSYYKGQHTGTYGKVAALSFNGNKTITTGGGGAIITNNEQLAKQAKHLTTTAKIPHNWEYFHDQVGFNYRLPNINAALGCAQLEQLPQFIEKKRELAQKYEEVFATVPEVKFFKEPSFSTSNYWLNAILLNIGHESQRDGLLDDAAQENLMLRPIWALMNRLPMFQNCPSMDLSTASSLEQRVINIPSSSNLIV